MHTIDDWPASYRSYIEQRLDAYEEEAVSQAAGNLMHPGGLKALEDVCEQVKRARSIGEVPRRTNAKRLMPSVKRICLYHGKTFPDGAKKCWRCGRPIRYAPVRAHVIDRMAYGLDNEANLRLLCEPCHEEQPPFVAGEEDLALAWFRAETRYRFAIRLAQFLAVLRASERVTPR